MSRRHDSNGNGAAEKQSWVEIVDGKKVRFIAWFRHWRSGKIIRAKDYGHKAFMIFL